ncbi:EAL domain-containing protein [Deinococcus hohokamensis]|uniref:EAL domain-containing protein n=1 Tax=Deinococcus hohokamensis TaxID=309883 RepID=A0ABV9IBN4_9DEIO
MLRAILMCPLPDPDSAASQERLGAASMPDSTTLAAQLIQAETAVRAGQLEVAQEALHLSEGYQTLEARRTLLRGLLSRAQGDSDEALECFQVAAQLAEDYGQPDVQADALMQLAQQQYRHSHSHQALQTLETALKIRESLVDIAGMVNTQSNMALILIAQGDQEKALRVLQRALTALNESGLSAPEIHVRANLAMLLIQRGELEEAQKQYLKALSLAEISGEAQTRASLSLNSGDLYQQMGDAEKAKPLLQFALEEARRLRNKPVQAGALHSLAMMHTSSGEHEVAERYLQEAYELAEQQGDMDTQIDVLLGLGGSLLGRHQPVQATEPLSRALTLSELGSRKQKQVQAHLLLASANEPQEPYETIWHLRRVMELQGELSNESREQQLRDVTAQLEVESAKRAAEYERELREKAERTVQAQLTELERGRLTDHLTGLPNRLMLRAHLDQVLRQGQPFSLLVLDVDQFKVLNDSYGHDAADNLLREVAGRLQQLVGSDDILARTGPDEYTLLSTLDPAELERRVDEALGGLSLSLDTQGVPVTISAGLAQFPQHGRDGEELRRAATLALQDAQREGSAWRIYNPAQHTDLGLEHALSQALAHGEFELHYQPVMDDVSGKALSAEALLRWNSPQHGPQSPAVFIPLLERSGLIVQVGDWALHEACRAAAGWGGVRVAVNLSARQFASGDLIATVRSALDASGLPPERLDLEITESLMMQNPTRTADLLGRLRAMGVGVLLDDFGTGYSSLSYIHHFPLTGVKIDREFVRQLDTETRVRGQVIIRAVVQICGDLGLKVVAEGIETPAQQTVLREMGVSQMQGFLFARPTRGWTPTTGSAASE